MIGKLLAPIPGQGLIEFAGQLFRVFDQGGDDAFGGVVGDLDQHHVARMPLDQSGDVAVAGAAHEVAFPVAGDGAIFDGSGAFDNRDGILDLAEAVSFQRGVPRPPDGPPGPEMVQQFFLSTPRVWMNRLR